MAHHHPDEGFLLDYATGVMAEPLAVVIACHLTLCPCCRTTVAQMEHVGGALLERVEGEPLEPDCFEAVMARIAQEPTLCPAACRDAATSGDLPRPLMACLSGCSIGRTWQRPFGIEMQGLPCKVPGHHLRLLRIQPGRAVPRHSHDGIELAIVLKGAFSDASGTYGRGDIACADGSVDHRQAAEPGEPCVCLVATTGRLTFTGPFGPLLNLTLRL